MPIWASLFAVRMLGEKLTPPRIAALLLGVAGLAVLMSQDLSKLANAPLGAALTLMAAVSFGFGTVWMKRRRWQVDPTVVGGWQLLLGAVPIWLIWALLRPEVRWGAVSAESWLAMASLALVSNALAYFAWFRVVAIFPAMVSGIGTLGVPVVGVLSSAAIVGEAIGWRELTALVLVCSALSLILFVRSPASRPAAVQAD
jgi:drug/metabolite transporter (DMT)-like permease